MGHDDRWRRGAVLVPILAATPHSIVFVERAQHLRRHPGQIGFPGGMADAIDAGDPVTTALRELAEELGVAAKHVMVVGKLDDLSQAMNRFVITPIVGILDAQTCFSIDGNEIVGVFTVPLDAILMDGAIRSDDELTKLRGKAMYALTYEGRRIWGFTARILKSFVDAWNAPAPSLADTVRAALAAR